LIQFRSATTYGYYMLCATTVAKEDGRKYHRKETVTTDDCHVKQWR